MLLLVKLIQIKLANLDVVFNVHVTEGEVTLIIFTLHHIHLPAPLSIHETHPAQLAEHWVHYRAVDYFGLDGRGALLLNRKLLHQIHVALILA